MKRVLALGFFDGVHTGHGALLRTAKARAEALGATPAVFSFDRPPKEVVFGTPVALLSSSVEREALIRSLYGINDVLFAPFDDGMRTTLWSDFIDLLIGRFGAVHLVAGHDFRFGFRNEGTPEKLLRACAERGIGCDIIPAVTLDGEVVSSTAIRAMLQAGDVERAVRFLGHPHLITGTVTHGRGVGHSLGAPTLNFETDEHRALPKDGVYAAFVGDERRPALTNVGTRPTFGGGKRIIETHVLGENAPCYGDTVSLHLFARLRDEIAFPDADSLRRQIERDVRDAEKFFPNAQNDLSFSI